MWKRYDIYAKVFDLITTWHTFVYNYLLGRLCYRKTHPACVQTQEAQKKNSARWCRPPTRDL